VGVLAQILCQMPAAQAQSFGEWGPAASVDPARLNEINTEVNDGCPIESPDGRTLYFASNRAGTLDIWVAHLEDGEWRAPARLPFPVNTDNADEFCPTPLPGNQLLFVSTRANNCGGAGNNPDFYYTRAVGSGGWLQPAPLNCEVNSPYQEFSPSVVHGLGQTMLFFSSNREEPLIVPARHKIYVSVLANGDWGPATLIDELNASGASDARPNARVRDNGLEIVFDSTRSGGTLIFYATRASIHDEWSDPVALDAGVNLGTSQSRASISRDGTRLHFGSNAENQPGDTGADIFVATRSGPGSK
jgi:Tol biopolymer transport system component